MRYTSLMVISALLCAQSAVAAIYKCTDSTGHTSFSSTPCGGAIASDENRIEAKAANIGGSLGVSEEQKNAWQQEREATTFAPPPSAARSYCKSYSSTTLRTLIVSNSVEPGMDAGSVARSWGEPHAVNGGEPVQWIYRWPQETSYVYFIDNCVWQVEGGYKR